MSDNEFRTPFEGINDDVIWDDWRGAAHAVLTLVTRALGCLVVALVITLIIVNLGR